MRRGFFGAGWAAVQKELEAVGAALEGAAAKLKAEQHEGIARMAKLQVRRTCRTSRDRYPPVRVHALPKGFERDGSAAAGAGLEHVLESHVIAQLRVQAIQSSICPSLEIDGSLAAWCLVQSRS